MNLDRLVAGLDIGSAKTTAVIAEVVGDLPKHPTVNILGVGQSRTSTGIASVTGSEITRSDVDRANAVARAQAIPQDRELIHAIPQEYTVDKNKGIRDPIGMIGTRLETEMYLVTIGASPAMNLRKAVERAGYRVGELVLEPLASALSVLTEDEKELGVALVEMGAGTTDVAVFHEGKIRYLGTVGYGGLNVTSDIVQGLGVTQADAERLKEQYGAAYEPLVKHSGEQIRLPSTGAQGERQIPRDLLAHIIHQRTQEIFEIVLRDIEEAGLIKKLSAGVVVTGGAAAQPGTAELARDVFGTGARLGVPGEFLGGLADSVQAPRFSTVTGLVQYGAHRVAIGTSGGKGKRLNLSNATPSMDSLAARFKTWLQDFF